MSSKGVQCSFSHFEQGKKHTEVLEDAYPPDWRMVRLDNITLQIQSGFASGERSDDGVVQLRMNNISTDGRVICNSVLRVPAPADLSQFILEDSDVIFNNTNSVDLIGKTAIFRGFGEPCTFSNHLTRIKVDAAKTTPEWILYNFIQKWERGEFRRICQRHVGQAGISGKDLVSQRLPLPPLSEQHRIGKVLATIDEAIALTDGVVNVLETVRESTGRKLFSEGIGHTDFVRTRLGSYPGAWDLKPLGQIAEIGSGATLGRKLTGSIIQVPYLRVANVQDGYLDLSTVKYIDILESEREKWLLKVGDILLTEGGDWDKLGRGTMWNGEIENCIHQNHIFRVRLTDPAFDVRFVHYLLSSFFGKAYFKQASKQSTNLASINQRQLRNFVVLQPPLEEQHQIAATLSAFDDRLALERAERDRLVALKKGLMQVLLTGRVRVPPGVAEGVAPAHA